jgi:acetyltransferase
MNSQKAPFLVPMGAALERTDPPYPMELTRRIRMPDGRMVTLRPIRPADQAIARDFVNGLSPRSKYQRFMFTFRELPSEVLVRFTHIDYRRDMALIAVLDTPEGERQVGVARYSTLADGRTCEFAIVVADDWQGRGLARELMQGLIDAACDRGLRFMTGVCLQENVRMRQFARAFRFVSTRDPDDPHLVRMRRVLERTADGSRIDTARPAAEVS